MKALSILNRRRLLSLALAVTATSHHAAAQEAEPERPRRFMMENAMTGEVIDDDILLGKVSLLYFGYTHCPDICPTSLLQMADVLKKVGADSDRVQPIFVTVDPSRDTATVMQEYVTSIDSRIVPLRGPIPYTDAMVKAFNAQYEIQKPNGDDPGFYSVDHTASIALIAPDARLLKRFPFGQATEVIVKEVQDALRSFPPEP